MTKTGRRCRPLRGLVDTVPPVVHGLTRVATTMPPPAGAERMPYAERDSDQSLPWAPLGVFGSAGETGDDPQFSSEHGRTAQ